MGKFFSKLYYVWAWVWNHVWGTLCIVGGVYGLFHPGDVPFYVPFLAIGVGVYFYWSPSWSRAAERVVEDVASRSGESDAFQADENGALPAAPRAESDAELAKKVQRLRIAGMALVVVAVLWQRAGVQTSMTPLWLGLLLAALAALSAPAYVLKLLPRRRQPSVPMTPMGTGTADVHAAGESLRSGAPIVPSAEGFPAPGGPGGAADRPKSPTTAMQIGAVLLVVAVVGIGVFVANGQGSRAEPSVMVTPSPALVVDAGTTDEPKDTTSDQTGAFVAYVMERGGTVLINAKEAEDSDPTRPALDVLTSAEPFFDWVVPLVEGGKYTIGDRSVNGEELWDYVGQQEPVKLDVVCNKDGIVSINCRPELTADGEEVLSTRRAMEVSDLLYEAPADGSEAEVAVSYSGESDSSDGSVWIEIRYDTYVQPIQVDIGELGGFYVGGKQVSSADFLRAVRSKSSSKGGLRYSVDGVTRCWIGADQG